MADLTTQLLPEAGASINLAPAAAGGDKFVWDPATALVIRNDDTTAKTVTLTPAVATVTDPEKGALTKAAIVRSVAAGEVAIVPPVSSLFRNEADANKVAIAYSAVTSLRVAAVRF
jgi:hypothetical protein